MKNFAEEGAHAPPPSGAGEVFAEDGKAATNSESQGGTVPEGGGTSPEVPAAPSRPAYIAAMHAAGGEPHQVDAPPALFRNGKQLTVRKRDGRTQPLKMFKLRSRVHRLMKGLNSAFVREELVVDKVRQSKPGAPPSQTLPSPSISVSIYSGPPPW